MAMCKKKNGDSADVCTANAAGKYNHCRRRVKSLSGMADNRRDYEQAVCTWYAWKMAYERTGVALPGLGNGGEWYDNARNHGYSVGTTAVAANCIAVWTDSGFGHVGFVESVSNGRMHVLEGGRTDIAGA